MESYTFLKKIDCIHIEYIYIQYFIDLLDERNNVSTHVEVGNLHAGVGN